MLPYLRFEIRRNLRSSGFLLVLVGLPVALYLIYGRDQAVIAGASFNAFYLVAMSGFSITGSAMSATGPGLATERMTGWMRQILVTPLSGRAWTASRVILGLVLIAPGVIVLSVVAAVYGGVRLGVVEWAALAGVFLLGALPFILIGLLIGLTLSVRTGSLAHMVVFLGLSVVSGVLVPWPNLPDVVQIIGQVFPLYHMVALGWEIVGDAAVTWLHLPALVAWTAALTAVLLGIRRLELIQST